MSELHTNTNEQNILSSNELAQEIGMISFKGLSLSGDRKIIKEPYVDGENDSQDYYVDVSAPSDSGQLETSKVPLETALSELRKHNGYHG